jgi:hypothetical protein
LRLKICGTVSIACQTGLKGLKMMLLRVRRPFGLICRSSTVFPDRVNLRFRVKTEKSSFALYFGVAEEVVEAQERALLSRLVKS